VLDHTRDESGSRAMRQRILEYGTDPLLLGIDSVWTVEMPDDAAILSVHTRGDPINLVALVDLVNAPVQRRFVVEMHEATTRNWTAADYIGSTVWGEIAFHLFELPQ
jgi:hypothetical protein